MATLPNTYQRRPTPRFGGVDRANPVVEDPGVAEGRGIQALATGMGQFLQREKAKRDKIQLEDYTTRAKREAMLLTKEYQKKKGAAVENEKTFYMDAMNKYTEMREKILSEVDDADVHKALDQRLELGSVNFQEGLINHVHTEQQTYGAEVYGSTIEVEQENAGANFRSNSEVMQSTDRIRNITHDYAKAKGIPLNSDIYKKMLRDNLTKAHVNVIEAWVQADNPEEAQEYFTEVIDEIDGDVHDNIREKISQADDTLQSQTAVDGYIARKMTRSEAKADARNTMTGVLRDNTINRIEARYNEIDNALTQQKKTTFDDTLAEYEEWRAEGLTPTQAFDNLDKGDLFDMGGTNQHRLRAIRDSDIATQSGTAVKTDMATYFELDRLIRDNPEQAKQLNLSAYRHLISSTDLKQLNTLRQKDPKILLTEKQIIDQALLDMDIDPSKIADDGSEGEKGRAFRTWVQNELSPDWDKNELQEVVTRGKIKVMVDEDILFDDYLPAYLAGTEFDVPGLHPSAVDDMAQAVESIGLQVTIENIQYAEMVRQAGMPVTIENIEALRAQDLLGEDYIPSYGKQTQDFPGG